MPSNLSSSNHSFSMLLYHLAKRGMYIASENPVKHASLFLPDFPSCFPAYLRSHRCTLCLRPHPSSNSSRPCLRSKPGFIADADIESNGKKGDILSTASTSDSLSAQSSSQTSSVAAYRSLIQNFSSLFPVSNPASFEILFTPSHPLQVYQ